MKSGICWQLALILVCFLIERTKCRLVEIEELPDGKSKHKPRALHIRNNLEGLVEIIDDPVWSLNVRIKGERTEIENTVNVVCKVNANDTVLDIQVYRKPIDKSVSSWEPTPWINSKVTADIRLRIPPYMIMPGSKVFHISASSSDLKFKGNSKRYKMVIDQYEIVPVNEAVDVTNQCYSQCQKACDLGFGTCIPCERGYRVNAQISNQNAIACIDINECETGRYRCPDRTYCVNKVGGYECKCRRGFYAHGDICKVCSKCPANFYEISICNSTHDVICKACSPPCEGYQYEIHQCGIAYDRFCKDITENLIKVDLSKIPQPTKVIKGSQLFASPDTKKYVIMDNRMQSAKTVINFTRNENKQVTVTRSGRCDVEIRLTNIDVSPIYEDFEATKQNENGLFGNLDGFKLITDNFCRFPAPDYFTLSHKLLENRDGLIETRNCRKQSKIPCPADAKNGEKFAFRTSQECKAQACATWDPNCRNSEETSNLRCSGFVGLASAFGLRESSFRDRSPWKFRNQDCHDLFMSCKTCTDNCNRNSNRTCCYDYCTGLCDWYRKNNCARMLRMCAKGDLSEFEVKGVFKTRNNDLRNRFNCYLRHKIPKKLFDVQYRFVVKGTNLEGRWRNIDWEITKSDDYSFDFKIFRARYRLGDFSSKTVLLTGYDLKNSGGLQRYEIRQLRAMNKNDLKLENNKLRFQLIKPFEISTANWNDIENCRKLTFWEKYFSKNIYKPQSNVANATIEKLSSRNQAKLYKINHKNSPANVEISIPATTSILREFQSRSRLFYFNATIKSNASIWLIHLRGNVTFCPAFLDIRVVEATAMTELLRQDIIIMCPLIDFHFFVTIPKIRPIHKERLFIIHMGDGEYTYEARVEKRQEIEVAYSMKKRPKQKVVKKHANLWEKLFPLMTLSGCFVIGLLSLMVYARISRPDKSESSRNRGYQLAAIKLGDADAAEERIEKQDRMKNRFLIPIAFLVAARVAYSFLLTVSVITLIFFAINKEQLEILKDVHEFVATKVNESNRISLALDQFRESEIKFMTDRAAFLECACDYHMGRILRRIRDNMSSIVQLHDVIAYDQISKTFLKTLQIEANRRRRTEGIISNLAKRVRLEFRKIQNKLEHYGMRVRHNRWFKVAKFLYTVKNMDFLEALGAFNLKLFKNLKQKIIDSFNKLKNSLGLSALVRRLKAPFYPIANFLLAPIRHMKAKVKEKLKNYIKELKNEILRNIPCYGDVDTRKWESDIDDFEKASKDQCKFSKANKFVEKIVDTVNSMNNNSDRHSIKSATGDKVYNVLEGDKVEEDYEKKQASRLEKLKKVGAFYRPEYTAKAALKYLKGHSLILMVTFDVLLIIYRNIKTYKFAFMMAAGYEVLKQHKNATDESGNLLNTKDRSFLRKVIDRFAKSAGGMYRMFEKSIKLIFTTLVIPILIISAGVIALFYLVIAFTYNAMNIQTLDELGAFKLLSARLDVTQNVTRNAVNEHATYLNRFDLGMYKETVKAQTQEFRNSIDDFNAEEIIKMKRLKAEICAVESDNTCDVDIDKLVNKLNLDMKPCVLPVIKARMPDDIYNSKAYRLRLKYESKSYIDAFRQLILNTFYLIIALIGIVILTIGSAKIIFKFLASQGMIRFRNKHVYEEIPTNLKKEYHSTAK